MSTAARLRPVVVVVPIVVVLGLAGCAGAEDAEIAPPVAEPSASTELAPASLEMRQITDDALAEFFTKRIDVFGVPIVASAATADDKVWHVAAVMAEYLDNDEDGIVDNPPLVAKMVDEKAMLIMFADFDELENSGLFDSDLRHQYRMQDCEGHETNPGEGFDAALEEVIHLISHVGYAELYPEAFAERPGTLLGDAMDLARGGRFEEIPPEYPDGAWYTYDDETCDYNCQAGEYFYWALTTILGAQADPERCEWISNEWRPCTREQIAEMDAAVFELMTDPQYQLPTRLPDGEYRQ